jgi:predicted ArsR family transcriptional regulator
MDANPPLEAIADRTRLDLLRALAGHEGAALAELAAAAGVHPNTARPRLRDLERAGMVERVAAPARGRGRPALHYRIAEGWRLPTADFLGLAELLGALVLRASVGDEQLDALGRDWGRFLAGRPGTAEVDRAVPASMARLGFDARVTGKRVVLSACPCPLVMPGRPQVLCRLATAAMSGVLEAAGSDLQPAEADHDPGRRVCTVRLRALAGGARPSAAAAT